MGRSCWKKTVLLPGLEMTSQEQLIREFLTHKRGLINKNLKTNDLKRLVIDYCQKHKLKAGERFTHKDVAKVFANALTNTNHNLEIKELDEYFMYISEDMGRNLGTRLTVFDFTPSSPCCTQAYDNGEYDTGVINIDADYADYAEACVKEWGIKL